MGKLKELSSRATPVELKSRVGGNRRRGRRLPDTCNPLNQILKTANKSDLDARLLSTELASKRR